jgi:TolB-like protein/tetratricopeptide (TPR) repeat protein
VLDPNTSSADRVFRFGSFELSERDGKLRKNGIRIKLQDQPFRVLMELLSNASRLVTREHLQQKLWPADTFVDFDVGLNTAIRKIRHALGDDADRPRYIETVARRGYVFLMAVETLAGGHAAARQEATLLESPSAASGNLVEEFWIAVLPFKYASANTDLQALAESFGEEIVAGLSRFSYLRVTSRNFTGDYGSDRKYRDVDVRSVANDPKARYMLEGSIRSFGCMLRITVQLVDAISGAHLWAETYDRSFHPEELFALQDDVIPRIVSTVADVHGILPHNMGESIRNRDPETLTPYEAVLRSFTHFQRVSAEDHAAARTALERAVNQTPGYADGWAMLSMVVREEYTHGFNVRPDILGRALFSAQRAVEIAPSNHLAHHALATAQFFRGNRAAFLNSAERAIALNPMDGFTAAYLGFLIAYNGGWERGCELASRARKFNPNHPGWYWFPSFFDAYRKKNYHEARDFALKINMPGFWRTNLALAAVHGQLGEAEAARKAVQALLVIRPDFPVVARDELAKWWDADLIEQLIEGLSNAGLEVAPR